MGGVDPIIVVTIVGGIGIVAAIIAIGSQVLSSAGTTKKRLDDAAALTPTRKTTSSAPATPTLTPAAPGTLKDAPTNFMVPSRERFLHSDRESAESDPTPRSDTPASLTFGLLNNYYQANLSQSNTIFWASLLAMMLGFAVIFVGVVLAGVHSTTALVAAIAGVLSQFIGATFLIVLRSTQAQATTFAQTLVDLRLHDVRSAADAHALNVGLKLIDAIAEDGANALANQTRATIALGLIIQGEGSTPPPTPPPPAPRPPTPAPFAGGRDDGTVAQIRTRAETISFDQAISDQEQRVEREKA